MRSDGKIADRPFSKGNSSLRDPVKGFLDIPKQIVEALTLSADGKSRRLMWGAIDFYGESGDVMHFELRSGSFYHILQQAVITARAQLQ